MMAWGFGYLCHVLEDLPYTASDHGLSNLMRFAFYIGEVSCTTDPISRIERRDTSNCLSFSEAISRRVNWTETLDSPSFEGWDHTIEVATHTSPMCYENTAHNKPVLAATAATVKGSPIRTNCRNCTGLPSRFTMPMATMLPEAPIGVMFPPTLAPSNRPK